MTNPIDELMDRAYLARWCERQSQWNAEFAAWSAAVIAAGAGPWPDVPTFADTYEINAEDCISINSGAGFQATSDTITALAVSPPVVTPFGPITPMPPPGRFVKFGGYMVCSQCKMAQEWCGCAKQAATEAPPKDGADSSLERRARECMGGK